MTTTDGNPTAQWSSWWVLGKIAFLGSLFIYSGLYFMGILRIAHKPDFFEMAIIFSGLVTVLKEHISLFCSFHYNMVLIILSSYGFGLDAHNAIWELDFCVKPWFVTKILLMQRHFYNIFPFVYISVPPHGSILCQTSCFPRDGSKTEQNGLYGFTFFFWLECVWILASVRICGFVWCII